QQLKALIKSLNETIHPAPQLKLGGNKQELIDRIVQFITLYHHAGNQVVIRQIRHCVLAFNQGDISTIPIPHPKVHGNGSIYRIQGSSTAQPTKQPMPIRQSQITMRHPVPPTPQQQPHVQRPYTPPFQSTHSSIAQRSAMTTPQGFKPSPFYEEMQTLSPPRLCTDAKDRTLSVGLPFSVPPMAASHLKRDSSFQIMVFCRCADSPPNTPFLMEFPHVCEIKINGRVLEANLRGMKNKPGTVAPANITRLCRLDSAEFNKIEFVYANSTKRYYASVHLVKRTSVETVVQQVERGKFLSDSKPSEPKPKKPVSSTPGESVFVIDEDGDSSNESEDEVTSSNPNAHHPPVPAAPTKPVVEVIDLISDSEDDEPEPNAGREMSTKESVKSPHDIGMAEDGISHSVKSEVVDRSTRNETETAHSIREISSTADSSANGSRASSVVSPSMRNRVPQRESTQDGLHSTSSSTAEPINWENTEDVFMNTLLQPSRRKRQYDELMADVDDTALRMRRELPLNRTISPNTGPYFGNRASPTPGAHNPIYSQGQSMYDIQPQSHHHQHQHHHQHPQHSGGPAFRASTRSVTTSPPIHLGNYSASSSPQLGIHPYTPTTTSQGSEYFGNMVTRPTSTVSLPPASVSQYSPNPMTTSRSAFSSSITPSPLYNGSSNVSSNSGGGNGVHAWASMDSHINAGGDMMSGRCSNHSGDEGVRSPVGQYNNTAHGGYGGHNVYTRGHGTNATSSSGGGGSNGVSSNDMNADVYPGLDHRRSENSLNNNIVHEEEPSIFYQGLRGARAR
ncbi:SUMO ligase siz1, partial [Lunasporangiospora selenospora]